MVEASTRAQYTQFWKRLEGRTWSFLAGRVGRGWADGGSGAFNEGKREEEWAAAIERITRFIYQVHIYVYK